MRIVVYPHDLGIGGSQLNAIELAAAVRDQGHEVLIFGRPGTLNSRVDQLALEFVESPKPSKRPSPSVAAALSALVRSRRIDLVHGYEWPPTLEAGAAMLTARRAPLVSTVMSMSVPPFIPHSAHLIVGTEEIAAAERQAGRHLVSVIEPPVDLAHNGHGAEGDVQGFRREHGLDESRLNIVSVARFAHELKLEGILTAIDEVGRLASGLPVRLVLVGDGPARAEVERRAQEVNLALGQDVVVLTGQVDDPRPAYAIADISIGMGGSALRALAFGSPLIVQGEAGFWRTLSPESVDQFLWTGWYGVGRGRYLGAQTLRAELERLVTHRELRASLGSFGLDLVTQRFSLTRAAQIQIGIYAEVITGAPRARRFAESASLMRYARYYAAKRVKRSLGREAADDFNARPVTAVNVARGVGYG